MTEADRPQFARLLALLGETFNEQISELRAEAYFAALRDFEWPAVQKVGEQAIRVCKFFPKPAEIRELVEGSPDDRAERAWEQIWRAMAQVGSYCSVWIEDPITARALVATFGSWLAFGQMELEPPMKVAKHREFLAAFRAARTARVTPEEQWQAGYFERENRANPKPVKSGSPTFRQWIGVLRADGRIEEQAVDWLLTTGECLVTPKQLASGLKALPQPVER